MKEYAELWEHRAPENKYRHGGKDVDTILLSIRCKGGAMRAYIFSRQRAEAKARMNLERESDMIQLRFLSLACSVSWARNNWNIYAGYTTDIQEAYKNLRKTLDSFQNKWGDLKQEDFDMLRSEEDNKC